MKRSTRRTARILALAAVELGLLALVLAVGVVLHLTNPGGIELGTVGLFGLGLILAAVGGILRLNDARAPTPPRALRRVEELRRPAEWDRLTDAQRAEAIQPYKIPDSMAEQPPHDKPYLIDHSTERDVQGWVANLIRTQFQKEATSLVRNWLEDASPSAHLFVNGSLGYGMTSLVVSLAREVMASRMERHDGSITDNAVRDSSSDASARVVLFSRGDHMDQALLSAQGGVLVVPTDTLIDEPIPGPGAPGDSAVLRNALRTGHVGGSTLSVRVALIVAGDPEKGGKDWLEGFTRPFPEFSRFFRYQPPINGVTTWTQEAEGIYAALANGVAHRYGLSPFDPSGVAALVEEGARRADGLAHFRLITNLMQLHDLAFEAGKAAQLKGAAATSRAHVEDVLERQRMEYGAGNRRRQEAILRDVLIVPTADASLGQITGLAIVGGSGIPSRISVTVSPGREQQLIDIEREAGAADKDFVRGSLTMAGYLANRYGCKHPISVAARVRFEQSHADKEGGDSASAAELFALLSALAQVPTYSSLAITGAVGQYGEIQAIGDVNKKIEGFWEICEKRRRHEKTQCRYGYGVLIPEANAQDLMSRPEVAESIAQEDWFHVWPIKTVDEGLLLLTGRPADEIHRRVERRLRRFYRLAVRGRAA